MNQKDMVLKRIATYKEAMEEQNPEKRLKLLIESEKYKMMTHTTYGAFGSCDSSSHADFEEQDGVPCINPRPEEIEFEELTIINPFTVKNIPLVVAGFPGIGKTTMCGDKEKGKYLVDSDSSSYSWIVKDGEKVRNPNFVQDYCEHILEEIRNKKIVLCSTHYQILEHLVKLGQNLTVVIPSKDRKEEFLEIYTRRGDVFKDAVMENWDKWLDDLVDLAKSNKNSIRVYILKEGVFLSRLINSL